MTYGDDTGQMRESMAKLLSCQRIQQRLGGGNPIAPRRPPHTRHRGGAL